MIKIIHRPEIDYVSIDFKTDIEAKTEFKDGLFVRYNKKNEVIGIDITDSINFFSTGSDNVDLKSACNILGISESTMRRRVKENKIPYTKPNGKDYVFKKSDILKKVA